MFQPSERDRNISDDERRRRIILLRAGILMCLVMVLMDSNKTTHGRAASSSPKSYTPTTSIPTSFDFHPAITAQINKLVPFGEHDHNVTGLYKGRHNDERFFIQLKTIRIKSVPSVQYVYGIAKILTLRVTNQPTLFPLQGLLVSSSKGGAELTLLATPLFNQRLALQISYPRNISAGDTEKITRNSSYSSSLNMLLNATSTGKNGADEGFYGNMSSIESSDVHRETRGLLVETAATHNESFSVDVSGGPGLKLVTYKSLHDLADMRLSHGNLSREDLMFQSFRDDLLSNNFKDLLYPKFDAPHCNYTFTLKVAFSDAALFISNNLYPSEMTGSASAEGFNCPSFNISVASTLRTAELLDHKIEVYVALAVVISLLQIGLFVTQLRYATTAGTIGKMSIASLSGHAIIDSLLCIAHLMLCAAFSKFTMHFLTLATLELLLFSVFGMRCVVSIYQTRYAQDFANEGSAGLRQRLAVLHARFYMMLFLIMFALYITNFAPIILLCIFSIWVPQIIYSAVSGTRNALSYVYLFGSGLCRILLPLYVLGCPHNMFAIALDGLLYSPMTCIALVLWTGAQVLVIYLQDLWGPRFFVPHSWLPARYDYHRVAATHMSSPEPDSPASDIERSGLPECAICYCAVDTSTSPLEYMLTPCDHFFHEHCLARWMQIKLECPVCRCSLPSVE